MRKHGLLGVLFTEPDEAVELVVAFRFGSEVLREAIEQCLVEVESHLLP